MKIGFVFDDTLDKADGIQNYMFSLHAWLTRQGHEVHFLVGQTKRTDIPHVHSLSKNVNVSFNGNSLSIPIAGSKKHIKAVLEREQFDVLHVSVPYHPFMAGWVMLAAQSSTAIVGTFHILPYSKLAAVAGRMQALLSYRSQKRLQAMVSVSPGAQDFAKRVYGLDSTVVPNAFDYDRFAEAQPLPEYDDDVLTILFLGRLVPRKGCMILLQAINQLVAADTTYPAFRVVVCGGGELDAQLKQYATDHQLDDIVSFVGRVSEEDKPRYYASADISVFPSTGGESFGIVLVEAMASGRSAVIGGDNPGYRSVLADSRTGLFAVNDVDALAAKLAALLSDPIERQQLADWAKASAPQYDVEVVGKKIMALYEQQLQNNSKRS